MFLTVYKASCRFVVPSDCWQPSSECDSFDTTQEREKPLSSENQVNQVPGMHQRLSQETSNRKTEDCLQLLSDKEMFRTWQKHLSFSSWLLKCLSKPTQTKCPPVVSPDPAWALPLLGIVDVSTVPVLCALSSRLSCRAKWPKSLGRRCWQTLKTKLVTQQYNSGEMSS